MTTTDKLIQAEQFKKWKEDECRAWEEAIQSQGAMIDWFKARPAFIFCSLEFHSHIMAMDKGVSALKKSLKAFMSDMPLFWTRPLRLLLFIEKEPIGADIRCQFLVEGIDIAFSNHLRDFLFLDIGRADVSTHFDVNVMMQVFTAMQGKGEAVAFTPLRILNK